jgi:hypothetical protein
MVADAQTLASHIRAVQFTGGLEAGPHPFSSALDPFGAGHLFAASASSKSLKQIFSCRHFVAVTRQWLDA